MERVNGGTGSGGSRGSRGSEGLVQEVQERFFGFNRYLPGDFAKYLRTANGELEETFDALRDAVDRGYVQQDRIVPLQRLSKRASKAASGLIKYLRTATPPNEQPRRPRRRIERLEPLNPTPEPEPTEPPEPDP